MAKRADLNEHENYLEETGAFRHNSFYDVFEEERTEQEEYEYKRLIGMPLAEDYEELIDSLKWVHE